MNKADHKFHRTVKEGMERDSSQSPEAFFGWRNPSNRPIFISKRKKKK